MRIIRIIQTRLRGISFRAIFLFKGVKGSERRITGIRTLSPPFFSYFLFFFFFILFFNIVHFCFFTRDRRWNGLRYSRSVNLLLLLPLLLLFLSTAAYMNFFYFEMDPKIENLWAEGFYFLFSCIMMITFIEKLYGCFFFFFFFNIF